MPISTFQQHAGLTIEIEERVSDDGRIGRAWFHVYPSQREAEFRGPSEFSYRLAVGRHVRDLIDPTRSLTDLATEYGLPRVQEMIDGLHYERGFRYYYRLAEEDGRLKLTESMEEIGPQDYDE